TSLKNKQSKPKRLALLECNFRLVILSIIWKIGRLVTTQGKNCLNIMESCEWFWQLVSYE
ncbi:MAG: hypothetical protein RR413_12375, partial [Christensenellaceae bacterium]